MQRTKQLKILETIIGAYNLNIDGELHTFSVLYSGGMVPWYNGEMLFLPDNLYKDMLRDFLNNRGSDYIAPSVTEIAKDRATAINNYNNGLYTWEGPVETRQAYIEQGFQKKEPPKKENKIEEPIEEPKIEKEAPVVEKPVQDVKKDVEPTQEEQDQVKEKQVQPEENKIEEERKAVEEAPEEKIEEPEEESKEYSDFDMLVGIPDDFEEKFTDQKDNENEKETVSNDAEENIAPEIQETPIEEKLEDVIDNINDNETVDEVTEENNNFDSLSEFKVDKQEPLQEEKQEIIEKTVYVQNDELDKEILEKISELVTRIDISNNTNTINGDEIKNLIIESNKRNKQSETNFNVREIQNLITEQNKIINEQKNAINSLNTIVNSQKQAIEGFRAKIDKTQKMEKVRVKKTWAIMIIGVILMVVATICTQLFLPKAENAITLDPNADAEVHIVVHEDDGTDTFQRIGSITIKDGKLSIAE